MKKTLFSIGSNTVFIIIHIIDKTSFKFKIVNYDNPPRILSILLGLLFFIFMFLSFVFLLNINNEELSINVLNYSSVYFFGAFLLTIILLGPFQLHWLLVLKVKYLDEKPSIFEAKFKFEVPYGSEPDKFENENIITLESLGILTMSKEVHNTLVNENNGTNILILPGLKDADNHNWKDLPFRKTKYIYPVGITRNHKTIPLIPINYLDEVEKSDLGVLHFKFLYFVDIINHLYRYFPYVMNRSTDYWYKGGFLYSRYGHIGGRLRPKINLRNSDNQ